MPVPVRQMTPIVNPKTGSVHITSLSSPGKTACDLKCNGWRVAAVAPCVKCDGKGHVDRRKCTRCNGEGWTRVDCGPCKEAIFFPTPGASKTLERRARGPRGPRK